MTISVTARVPTHGQSARDEIFVRSHWNDNGVLGKVEIEIDDLRYTVASADLENAIKACTGLK